MQTLSQAPEFRFQKSAFTLLELLVVIAIIAVLAGLLLSAVNSAHNRALAVKCASNLRSVGTAISLYCTEHDGEVPLNNYFNVYSDIVGNSPKKLGSSLLPYLTSATVVPGQLDIQQLVCPLWMKHPGRNTTYGGTGTCPSSYYMAGMGEDPTKLNDENSGKNLFFTGWKLNSFETPSAVRVMYDNPYISPSRQVTAHGNRANVLYLDGHVTNRPFPFTK